MSEQILMLGTCEVHAIWPGKVESGTGWLAFAFPFNVVWQDGKTRKIERQYVITAGHLVAGATNVKVRFSNPRPGQISGTQDETSAKVIQHEYDDETLIDWAVLELKESIEGRIPPPLDWTESLPTGTEIQAYGRGFGLPGISPGIGQFVGMYSWKEVTYFRLRSQELATPGYSGSAIWAKAKGAVVAIQVFANTKPATKLWGQDSVLAFPLHALANREKFLEALPWLDDLPSFPFRKRKGSLNPQDSPYVGPRAFKYEETDSFSGRSIETDDLETQICESRKMLVYGPSGAGKSSLLATTVRRRLEGRGIRVLPNLRVGVLSKVVADTMDENANPYILALRSSLRAAGPQPFSDTQTLSEHLESFKSKLVLVIDQGEELFLKYDLHWKKRYDFFRQLEAALDKNRDLHVVFVIRKEYLADFERYSRDDIIPWQRFAVAPLSEEAAKEAIVKPALQKGILWDDDLVERIARELATVRRIVREPGKEIKVERVPGEFISPLYLQLLCNQIWAGMESGISSVTRRQISTILNRPNEDLDAALSAFVGDALKAFFSHALREASLELAKESNSDPKMLEFLLYVGCSQFVSSSGSRLSIETDTDRNRVGRLQATWAQMLESKQILQSVERDGLRFYELAHDRIADGIDRMRRDDSQLSTLTQKLRALGEEISAFLQTKQKFPRTALVTDDFSREQLSNLLYPEEIVYLLRGSLLSGNELQFWGRFIHETRDSALGNDLYTWVRNAFESPLGDDRTKLVSNAIRLIEHAPCLLDSRNKLERNLVSCLVDADAEVSSAAAECLASIDRPQTYEMVVTEVNGLGGNNWLDRLALIHAHHDVRGYPRANLGAAIAQLRPAKRSLFFWFLVFHRVKARGHYVLMAIVSALLASCLMTAMARAMIGSFMPTIMNGWETIESGLTQGIFHGAAGGAIWGATIAGSLAGYWIIFEGAILRQRLVASLTAGTLGGIVGGAILMSIVLGIYAPDSVNRAGWTSVEQTKKEKINGWSYLDRLKNSWFDTHVGLYYPVIGVILGFTAARCAFRQMNLPEWLEVAEKGRRPLRKALQVRAAKDLALFFSLAAVAFGLGFLCVDGRPLSQPRRWSLEWIITADSLTIVIGGYAIYAGLLIATYVARVGITFQPETKARSKLLRAR